MIEHVTGQAYRDYVREHIFGPAGMARSDFFRLDRVVHDVAEGADPIRDEHGHVITWKKNIYSFPPVGSPDSGAHVPAGDLDRFLCAVQAGKLLSPALTAEFLSPHVLYRETEAGRVHYGYGPVFQEDRDGEIVFYGKSGINVGVSAMLRHYPAHGINVVLLSNMEDGVWKPARKVHEVVMEKTTIV